MPINKKGQVLDPCCGGRMFWFDKTNADTVFGDYRKGRFILCDGRTFNVAPDQIFDFRALPFSDKQFNLIVYDPPHLKAVGLKSWLNKKYGCLNSDSWQHDLTLGFSECWRVLCSGGTLIFKWNETQIKIKDILQCAPVKPLFGHTTTQNLKTHWIVFYKSKTTKERKTKCQENGKSLGRDQGLGSGEKRRGYQVAR